MLREVEGASSEYQVMIDHLNGRDIMTIFFETESDGRRAPPPGKRRARPLQGQDRHHRSCPRPVSIGELPRSEKKSTRIYDNRY